MSVGDIASLVTAIFTAVAAVGSCVAAWFSYRAAAEKDFHRRKILKQKTDLVLLLRDEFQAMTPAKVRLECQQRGVNVLDDFVGDMYIFEIDGVLYCGGNIDMSKWSPFGARAWFMNTVVFQRCYVTYVGEKRWKQHQKEGKKGA